MANTQYSSTINAKRFAALFAGFDIGNDSEEEAIAKVRVMRRMAEEAGLRIIDVLELPEVRQAIDDQLSPKRSESPDLAVAVERISELEKELSERMRDVCALADRLAHEQQVNDSPRVGEPIVDANSPFENYSEPLPPSLTEWEQGEANEPATQSNAGSGWNGTAQVSVFHRLFWGALFAVVLAFCVVSWALARPVATLDDLNAFQEWPLVLIGGFLFVAAVAYFGTYVNDLDDPDNVRASLTSPRIMFFSVVGLAVPWGMLYTGWAQVMHQPLPANVRIVCLLTIAVLWWLMIGRRHFENFGVRGALLNILLLLALSFCCLVIPSYASSSTSTMIKSVIASLVLGFPLCSNAFAGWIFESESRFRGFAIVGAFFTLLLFGSIANDLDKPASKSSPQASATAPYDRFSPYEPEPPNSKYKWRIRKKRWIPPTLLEDARK